MLSLIKRHPRAFAFAVLVHVVFVVVMAMSVQWSERTSSRQPQVSVVEAVAVDEKLVAKELKRIKAAEQKKQRQLRRELNRAQQARKKEERRLADLKRKQAQQKKAEQKRLAELKKEKQLLEQKRQREEEQLKKAREQRAEEEKELRRLDQERKEEDLRRKMAEEQKRLAEQQRLAEQKRSERQSTIDRYRAMIEAEVRKHWQIPPGAQAGMACVLRVRLLPSGEVIRVELAQSSGNAMFDSSVQKAVRQASPLPVPSASSGLFDVFRDLRFPFKLEKRS